VRKFIAKTTYDANFDAKQRAAPRRATAPGRPTPDLGTAPWLGASLSKGDYLDWGVQPRVRGAASQPAPHAPQRFVGASTYSGDFVPHAVSRPSGRVREAHIPDRPLAAASIYQVDFEEKAIGRRAHACAGRAWMNCESCEPSAPSTPEAGQRPDSPELTWSVPPYATGKAKLDGRTHYRVAYPNWGAGGGT